MRKYEVGIIIDPDTDERQVTPILDKHLETITAAGGTVDKVDSWGKRRLAYEINKKPEGIYVFVDVTAEPAAVKELERLMSIDETIMRTKVIRPELHK